MARLILIAICSLIFSCKPADDPFSEVDILAEFIGHWKLLNSNSSELTQIIILKKESGRVSIQLWGECLPEKCEWGSRFFHQVELENGPLSMTWPGKDLEITQELSLLASGKLQIRSVEDHVDDARDTVKTFLFTKDEKLNLFEQVSKEEALRANLSREKLNGSKGPENQLLPNSILLFRTAAGIYGKLQIRGNSEILTFRWNTWADNGSILREADYMETRANAYYDMNFGREIQETEDCKSDFFLEEISPLSRSINPQCGAVFALYHVGT